jgi:hypothetical protein
MVVPRLLSSSAGILTGYSSELEGSSFANDHAATDACPRDRPIRDFEIGDLRLHHAINALLISVRNSCFRETLLDAP